MLSKFFLDRPVFAWVIAIILLSLGGLAIYSMPISQYPPIAPPSISITAYYAGASAETVENTVTQIIEQKMTGLDGLLYLSGTSSSSGQARIELTFAPGTDPDYRLVQGPKQAAAGHGQSARYGATRRHQGQQIHPELPDRGRPDLRGRQHARRGPARLCPVHPGKDPVPGAGRR